MTITSDPVCGMEVEATSLLRSEHEGDTYLFCSAGCRAQFEVDPDRFTKKRRISNWSDYLPLLVIIALTLLAACAKQVSYGSGWIGMTWMHDFMGLFLVVFSMFKFFNLGDFADGFQKYDLLAKPLRPYAYLYPFIELALGLGYLAHWQPKFIYATTVAVMVFGSLGVVNALRKGLNLDCACMGSVLKVPLSTVALLEDLGMAAMAAAMLLFVR